MTARKGRKPATTKICPSIDNELLATIDDTARRWGTTRVTLLHKALRLALDAWAGKKAPDERDDGAVLPMLYRLQLQSLALQKVLTADRLDDQTKRAIAAAMVEIEKNEERIARQRSPQLKKENA